MITRALVLKHSPRTFSPRNLPSKMKFFLLILSIFSSNYYRLNSAGRELELVITEIVEAITKIVIKPRIVTKYLFLARSIWQVRAEIQYLL